MTHEQPEEHAKPLQTALYIRLSREDEDQAESMSVGNQRLQLTAFVGGHAELRLYDIYIDDGYTGTNLERPAFLRMIRDIEEQNVQCVVVKDLSRLGRNLAEVSRYINEYFPSKKVRFIAINDGIDKRYFDFDANADMMIDFKNLFNGLYPRDISKKVRSTFRSKQGSGQFIGAFACFGYVKSAADHNRLEIDAYAAGIVGRIFDMYAGGVGQSTIAKILNEENIPCPSEYKKRQGLNYRNGRRLATTAYWTYATVRNILKNEMYLGNMVQNKSFRQMCQKNAVCLPRAEWIVVEGTHEPLIDRQTWDKVQDLLNRNTRQTGFAGNVHLFAGYLRCGDCGRAMVKIKRKGVCVFNCGSYNRYGRKFCSMHSITERELEEIVLTDLNRAIASVGAIGRLIDEERQREERCKRLVKDASGYRAEIERLSRKKERAYEDYADGLITRAEYVKYRDKYEQQTAAARAVIDQMTQLQNRPQEENPWIEELLRYGRLRALDRETVTEAVSMIYVYEKKDEARGQEGEREIKIEYRFSNFHQPTVTVGE